MNIEQKDNTLSGYKPLSLAAMVGKKLTASIQNTITKRMHLNLPNKGDIIE